MVKCGGSRSYLNMALFNRSKKDQTISDLENYYYGKNRGVRVWLMAALSLVATVVVIAGFFFGGRWVYNSLNKDDSVDLAETNTPTLTLETNTPNEQITPDNTDDNDYPGVVSDEAVSTSVPSSVRQSTQDSSVVAGASNTKPQKGSTVPNTGASTSVVLIPFIAAILGYIGSRNHILKNL